MATEKQAQMAKDQHLDFLDRLGAHSVLVDKVNLNGKKTFAVIAYTEKKIDNPPLNLQIESGKKIFNIPLVINNEAKLKIQ